MRLIGCTILIVTGVIGGRALVGAAVSLPAMYAGWECGAFLGPKLDATKFRIFIVVLLVVSAVVAFLTALNT